MKRIAAALLLAGTSVAGFVTAAPAASAADCPAGTVLQAHVYFNINGQEQSQDVCLPPSS
jgi:hypothetical protein